VRVSWIFTLSATPVHPLHFLSFHPTDTHHEHFACARVEHSDLLVLAGGDNLGAIGVPGGRERDVRERINLHQSLSRAHVPDEDLVVGTCDKNKVLPLRELNKKHAEKQGDTFQIKILLSEPVTKTRCYLRADLIRSRKAGRYVPN
jgi:hypothetical protein